MAQKTLLAQIVLGGQVDGSFKTMSAALQNVGSYANEVSQKLIELGTESIEKYSKYEYTMTEAFQAYKATFDGTHQELLRYYDELDSKALEWTANTRYSYEDVTKAVAEAAHSGWDFEQTFRAVPIAMKLANAGCMDLSTALDMLVKTSKASGVGMEELDYYVDTWTFAANTSATNAEEMGLAMEKMGAVTQYAANPQEVLTLLGVLANAGTVGAAAGTMMKTAMLRLVAPTTTAQKAMDDLGISMEELNEEFDDEADFALAGERLAQIGFSAYDSQGNLKDFVSIFEDLHFALKDLSDDERNEVLYDIFGMRGLVGAENILKFLDQNGPDALRDYYNKIFGADNYAGDVSTAMENTLQSKLDILQGKIDALEIQFGKQLAPIVESVAEKIGGFVDSISGMDESKFAVLTGALEGMAVVGPGLLTAATAMKLMVTPAAWFAVLGLAAGAGIGAMIEAANQKYDGNFGTLALDMKTLTDSVDSLTTDTETKLAGIQNYVDAVSASGKDYETAAAQFSQNIAEAVLTGATLDPTEIESLKTLGGSLVTHVQSGISAAAQRDLSFLNLIMPDASEMTDEEKAAYESVYDHVDGYYGALSEEAEKIGRDLGALMVEALDGGIIDADEASAIQAYKDKLNAINAEISNFMNKSAYYAELEKAQRVDDDQIEEYLEYLDTNNKERKQEVTDAYMRMMGMARAGLEDELGQEISDEEWYKSDDYKDLSGLMEEDLAEIDAQTGELAERAIDSVLMNSGAKEAFQMIKDLAAEEGVITLDQAKEIVKPNEDPYYYIAHDSTNRAFETEGEWLEFLNSYGIGSTDEFIKQMEILTKFSKNRLGDAILQTFGLGGYGSFDYASGSSKINIWDALIRDYGSYFGFDQTSPIDKWIENVFGAKDNSEAYSLPKIQPQYASQEQTSKYALPQLEPTEVEVAANTETAEAQISAVENGEYEARIYVGANTDAAEQAINSMNGRNISVGISVSGSKKLITPGMPGFAEGGRADTASIFGEAGPEWAIPEEHTARTAELLSAAAAASGFSWGELLTSSIGKSRSSGTLIYSPTIVTQSSAGVSDALREDKERLEKWWRDKSMRDEVAAYA